MKHRRSAPKMPVLVGGGRVVRALRMAVRSAARTHANILIVGEAGTETETVARLIHARGPRRHGPFVSTDCGVVPPALVEAHLFGHARGSFPGAFRDKRGLVDEAAGGTLFLTQVDKLSLHTQAVLLGFLQSQDAHRGDARRAASRKPVRLITAAHRALEPLLAQHRFLPDLLYRVNVVQIHVPPVRDRDTDILVLLEHFLAEAAQRRGVPAPTVTAEAAQLLLAYAWPGNVAELQECAEHVTASTRSGVVTLDDVPSNIRACVPRHADFRVPSGVSRLSADGNSLRNGNDEPETQDVSEQVATPTREMLHAWIRGSLSLPPEAEGSLINAIDQVLLYYERVWRSSKDEALRAVATGFARRFQYMRDELSAREATSRNVARYFERVVADLTERTHRDAKTQLLHFRRFMEHVEIALSVDREGGWCALGVADITAFKALNDTFGHATGDRVLERVAELLRSEVRSSDLLGYQRDEEAPAPVHARFGGDEFCFFLSDLANPEAACTVAERFWDAVAEYKWATEDPRFATQNVTVDVGVACLQLGALGDRHPHARMIAGGLFTRADGRLYAVKRGLASHIACEAVRVSEGQIVEIGPIFSSGRNAGRDTA